MTTIRLLAITLCLTSALLLSGCASDDEGNGTTTDASGTTTGTMTTGTSTGTDAPPVDNATLDERSCTATAGGPGVGYVGDPSGTVYVGGCPFGVSDTQAILYQIELPPECDPYMTAPDASSTEAEEATVGTSYPAGTRFSMFCGAGANLVGTIQLQPVA